MGAGKVVWGEPLPKILQEEFGRPQFSGPGKTMQYIVRETPDSEIWFIANVGDTEIEGDCVFRTGSGVPEFWDPMTGSTRKVAAWSRSENAVTIPARFGPRESIFVVFSKGSKDNAPSGPMGPSENFATCKPILEIAGVWDVQFDPDWFYPDSGSGGRLRFEQLTDWSQHPDPAVKHFSGVAVYKKVFEAPSLDSAKRFFLELGEFKGIAEVHLNGKKLGTVWTAPWRVDVTDALREGSNDLAIHMANCWPNRLIGDEKLPADAEFAVNAVGGGLLKSWPEWLTDPNDPSPLIHRPSGRRTFSTYKHWNATDPLLTSGLLGPVRIVTTN